MNTNVMGWPIEHYWPKYGLINGFSGVAHFYVFLPFSVVSGPNLTFFKKIRWLDINLSYFHAKFQPILMKIEAIGAKQNGDLKFHEIGEKCTKTFSKHQILRAKKRAKK